MEEIKKSYTHENDEDFVSIDDWQPKKREISAPKSEWRKIQNRGYNNQQPGIDELKKINFHLKRKYPDHEIMEAFGINAETLSAIKKNRYHPTDGISHDNLSKIVKEFERIDKKIDGLLNGIKFLCDSCFAADDTTKRMALKSIVSSGFKQKKEHFDEEEE